MDSKQEFAISEVISLCRQVSFEAHKSVPPRMLVNQPCPFKCVSPEGKPGKIILRYHCMNWAHIRCENLQCMYQPFSVKNPVNLDSILSLPANPTAVDYEMHSQRIATLRRWMEFEKTLLDPTEFAEAVAKDNSNQHGNHQLPALTMKADHNLMPVASDAGTSSSFINENDQALAQQIYYLQETAAFNAQHKSHSKYVYPDEEEEEPVQKKRGRKKGQKNSTTVKPYYKPTGRKPGRPKGYSPVKARKEAELLKKLQEEAKSGENPTADSTSVAATNVAEPESGTEKLEVVHIGSNCPPGQKLKYYSHKPPKSTISIGIIAKNLFGNRKGRAIERARNYLVKALLIAARVHRRVPEKAIVKKKVSSRQKKHEINLSEAKAGNRKSKIQAKLARSSAEILLASHRQADKKKLKKDTSRCKKRSSSSLLSGLDKVLEKLPVKPENSPKKEKTDQNQPVVVLEKIFHGQKSPTKKPQKVFFPSRLAARESRDLKNLEQVKVTIEKEKKPVQSPETKTPRTSLYIDDTDDESVNSESFFESIRKSLDFYDYPLADSSAEKSDEVSSTPKGILKAKSSSNMVVCVVGEEMPAKKRVTFNDPVDQINSSVSPSPSRVLRPRKTDVKY